jgi:oxygen-dependent protoporphyrinogen oxidase
VKRIVVVGGGISGLTVAYLLSRESKEVDVSVLESEERPGGKIWTDRVDGFLPERGANGFLDNKPRTLELCRSLGIEPLRSNENAKKRYIFFDGQLNALPESPPSFLKSNLISFPGKLRMAYELIAPKGPEDETVADFILRRLGREALERLIDPMVSGVFAGDPYKMSITSCFPRIKELETEYGSLVRALFKIKKQRKKEKGPEVSAAPAGRLTSFYDGAQTIIDALVRNLGERVKTGVPVLGIEKSGSVYELNTPEGVMSAEVVVFASPAYASSVILREFDREIAKILAGIPYPSLSVVCLGYKKESVGHALDGFGFLIPHIEGKRILGTLWDSSIFPNRAPEGHVLLRTMIGGAQSPELAMLDDEALVSTVMKDLKPIVSLKTEPDMVSVYRWEKAIPQYLLGHGKKLASIEERLKNHPGLYITGNACRGVGINDCVENSYKLSESILSAIQT